MAAGSGGSSTGTVVGSALREEDAVWQDREIRFDTAIKDLVMRKGEKSIDSINSVEDTKGNNGVRGSLGASNLRLIWISHQNFAVNLSIGYSCIESISIRTVDSKLRAGRVQALHVMCKFLGNRYEFIFTSLIRESPRLFTTVQAVFRSYETSKLFRDLKLRGAMVRDGKLNTLPGEEIIDRIDGTWNLSSENGNLGIFFLTTVRIVWYATLAENFNVSVPYPQIRAVKTRPSKFGRALVIETMPRAGSYVLGFRIDPAEKLESVFRAVSSLHSTYAPNPNMGVEFHVEATPETLDAVTVPSISEDVEIVEGEEAEKSGGITAYLVAAPTAGDRTPVFDTTLGLAVEALPEGFTTATLWTSG